MSRVSLSSSCIKGPKANSIPQTPFTKLEKNINGRNSFPLSLQSLEKKKEFFFSEICFCRRREVASILPAVFLPISQPLEL
jgi:hypothetical protein